MKQHIREPFNALSHLFGAVLSLLGGAAMIFRAVSQEAPALHVAAVALFGITLILLYGSSTAYHWVKDDTSEIRFLRRVDHSMIYVLITGSYAPFCLITLEGVTGWTIFLLVAGLAAAGILLAMTAFNKYRKTTTVIYILMGWIIIFALKPLSAQLSMQGLILLVSGGVFYTIGGVLYGIEKALDNRNYHKVFHVFTLIGSFAHFSVVYFYIL
ncbi:PAQR family membrane homeostasis protein TrhA [Indiicoccus explosivorum]|uniref:PAQR family membrane homeostasis protein TrhA n=1 Tax=Indiicoccus explosivorum TaxID=1917864 RepID=UPI000B4388DA|nr:hemolysin III family protein [Indiicoccus explosivorum]